jgi:two-component system, chemotaxis family, CheB/CheR fusion protein
MNEELRQQSEELHLANGFLGTILASLRCGLAVLDGDLIVKAWSEKMEDFWGIRAEEVVGSHFLNLDFGMPLDSLRADIGGCLAAPDVHSVEKVVQCINRRGKPMNCRVTLRATRADAKRGLIVIVEEI